MDKEFRTLVSHFFGRFFDKDSRASDSDAYTGVVQMLALLLLPGLALSFFLLPDHPSARGEFARMWMRVGDRYVFICYAMVVMGLVMTLKWDSLFPDRRDYLILSSLPISVKRLFAAKVVALLAFLALFVVAINFFSMIMIPMIYPNASHSWSRLFGAFEAHALGVLGASVFTALFFAALQGILINVLTPDAFRQISPRIQMLSITVLVMVFLTLPVFKEGIRALSEHDAGFLSYLPFIWFLGLYESFLPGETLMPMAHAWGRTALTATGVVAVICAASYFAGYRRYSRKLLESIDSDSLTPGWLQTVMAGMLNRTILKDPFQRATFYFIGMVANRSSRHRIITALYTGAGIALAISFAFIFDRRSASAFPFKLSAAGALEAPVMLSLLMITGLRATFSIPYELGANWMFQITGAGRSTDYLKAVRKWVFLRRLVPLYALLSVLEFAFFNPMVAACHLTFDLLLTAFVIEVLFFRFNKVPFTCSYPADKFRMAGLAIAYFYGFVVYVAAMGGLKRWAAADLGHMAWFVVVAAGVLSSFSLYHRRADRNVRLLYRDETDPLVRGLNLT